MADEVEKKTSYSTGSQLQAEIEAGQRALARRRGQIQGIIDGRPEEAKPMQGNTDSLEFTTGLAPASVQAKAAQADAARLAVTPPQDLEEIKAQARAEAIAEERARVKVEQEQQDRDIQIKAKADEAARLQAEQDKVNAAALEQAGPDVITPPPGASDGDHDAEAVALAAAKAGHASGKSHPKKTADAKKAAPAKAPDQAKDSTDSAVDDILG